MAPWSLRDTVLHILAFPEIAYLSHEVGSMSLDDMQAPERTAQERDDRPPNCRIRPEGTRRHHRLPEQRQHHGFEREVPAHYGGEVTVLELLNIVLSHSTHHLKQVYHYMTTDLGMTVDYPATDADLEGIQTPDAVDLGKAFPATELILLSVASSRCMGNSYADRSAL